MTAIPVSVPVILPATTAAAAESPHLGAASRGPTPSAVASQRGLTSSLPPTLWVMPRAGLLWRRSAAVYAVAENPQMCRKPYNRCLIVRRVQVCCLLSRQWQSKAKRCLCSAYLS
jgi:hypothetical protein